LHNRCLGLYTDLHSLTAVLIEQQGDAFLNQREWIIPAPSDAPDSAIAAMAESLRQNLVAGDEPLPPVALALDSRCYQIQFHHSQFRDLKQIQQTLRFDAEELFALEGEELAASFHPVSASSEGTDLMVYSTKRQPLQQQLNAFHDAGLDPLAAQPDLETWRQYALHFESLPKGRPFLLLGILRSTCYLLFLDGEHRMILGRTFLFCPDESPEQSLRVELHRSLSLLSEEQQPEDLYYHPGNIPAPWLSCLTGSLALRPHSLLQRDPARAMAMGAAVQWLLGPAPTDFRVGDLKPQSLLKAQRKSLYILSACLSVMFLVLLFLTVFYKDRYQRMVERSQEDLQQAWKDANPDQKPPRALFSIPQKLKTQAASMRKTGRSSSGYGLSNSAGNVLLLLVNLLNKMPKPFDLWIEQLQVDTDSANLTGSVPSLDELVKLGDGIRKKDSPLEAVNWDFVIQQSAARSQGQGPSRRSFNLPIRVRKAEDSGASERKKR